MVFQAGIHGVDLNEGSKNSVKEKRVVDNGLPVFQSPEEYKNMTQEEREALTKKMMGKHKLKFG